MMCKTMAQDRGLGFEDLVSALLFLRRKPKPKFTLKFISERSQEVAVEDIGWKLIVYSFIPLHALALVSYFLKISCREHSMSAN